MTFARLSLAIAGLLCSAFGLAFLLNPEALAKLIEVKYDVPRGFAEVSATYGGMRLGLGAFFFVSGNRERWIRTGLLAQFLVFGGMAASRLYVIMTQGVNGRMTIGLMAIEAATAMLGMVAFAYVTRALAVNRPERR